MIFCSKFIKTITSSALLAGVASSSFVSGYDTKLRRGISCDEDKDISSRDSKLKDLTKKSDLLKSSDFKTVASIISTSSSIGILSGLAKKLYYDKKVNPTKPDEPKPYIQDDDKNKDNPDPHKKDEPLTKPDNLGNKKSSKLWWLMCVAPVILLVLVVVYKREEIRKWADNFAAAMYMKFFGVDKFVKNYGILFYNYDECKGLFKKILSESDFNNWEQAYYMRKMGPACYVDHFKDNNNAICNWKRVYKNVFKKDIDENIAEKLLYRHEHGYKEYIENYPDNWWELYTQGYIEPKFIPEAEKMYVFYVYDTESPLKKKMDEFYKKKPGRNNEPQLFKRWSEEYDKILGKKQEIDEYFANNFYKDLKTDISSLADYFFDDGINFESKDFIIKDGELKFLSNENEYDLDKFGTFLLDDDGDPRAYSSRATKCVYFTFLLKDDNEMLAGVIESLDKKLEYNKYLETYSLDEKNFFNDLFKNINNFLKLKFKNFYDNDEKKIFVDRKLESMKKIIDKANNGIEKAFEVYRKYKSSAESLKECKINFLADYILLDDNELKQKYKFLEDGDLKIEPKPVEKIIEMDNIINNNP